MLYSAFNRTELAIVSKEEELMGEELEQAKERLQVLKDRQVVIGGAGHKESCPCCGLDLPKSYFDNLVKELAVTSKKVQELEAEYSKLAIERENSDTNALTLEIERYERELSELEGIEKEAKELGLI